MTQLLCCDLCVPSQLFSDYKSSRNNNDHTGLINNSETSTDTEYRPHTWTAAPLKGFLSEIKSGKSQESAIFVYVHDAGTIFNTPGKRRREGDQKMSGEEDEHGRREEKVFKVKKTRRR